MIIDDLLSGIAILINWIHNICVSYKSYKSDNSKRAIDELEKYFMFIILVIVTIIALGKTVFFWRWVKRVKT